jgi:hypothetical protein
MIIFFENNCPPNFTEEVERISLLEGARPSSWCMGSISHRGVRFPPFFLKEANNV